MPDWNLHWLEAEGTLAPWRVKIAAEITAAHEAVAGFVKPPRLDILVQRLSGWVIPEIGMVGHAYRPSLFALTLDPDNANFATCVGDGTLRRQVAHEVHHCLRLAAIGWGRNLGDALINEGLAGHFVRQLFASPPEPWERAVDAGVVPSFFPEEGELASTAYDHNAWFFGTGGKLPRWIGYTLGYTIVGRWLETVGDVNGGALVTTAAAEVLSAWRRA